MRDPMSWSIPLFRAFGIPVKLHLLFPIIALGFFLRQVAWEKGNIVWWPDVLMVTVVLLFAVILLHEFGHGFAARWVGGEPTEILMWPLGGLAYADVPQNWRAHTLFAAGGPLANVAICLACASGLLIGGFTPNLNPLSNPYVSQMSGPDGRTYTSDYGMSVYQKDTTVAVDPPAKWLLLQSEARWQELNELVVKDLLYDRAVAPSWAVWLNRTFWLSGILLLLNLLPAYPLDGGQIMQGLIWARSDYRQGAMVAAYAGYVVGVLFFIASITANESLLMGLGLFVLYSSWMKLNNPEAEDALFGYDFSAGYTSLERDDDEPVAPRPRRENVFKRWLRARAIRRIQREIEQRRLEDERMDQLLDKIAQHGKASLTDEERHFMERVSARYKNRS
ncbi:MAG: site-2 protease family protein [Bacteroidales bacterium]|nr:site-2 protease family protein [Bacteroidales bacterium]